MLNFRDSKKKNKKKRNAFSWECILTAEVLSIKTLLGYVVPINSWAVSIKLGWSRQKQKNDQKKLLGLEVLGNFPHTYTH